MENRSHTIKCIKRIYEIFSGGRITRIASNKVITGDVLEALLHEDYELEKFIENFEVIGTSFISVIPKKEEIPLMKEEKEEEREEKEKEEEREEKEEEKKDEKLPTFAKLPNLKQRRWMILHELPDDREITQLEWVNYMVKKRYDRRQVKNNVAADFTALIELGKLQKISTGRYKIIDKDIYKDDAEFTKFIGKLKNGEKISLS